MSMNLDGIRKGFRLSNIMLAKLLVDEMVSKGLLCVDESDLEILYFENLILNRGNLK